MKMMLIKYMGAAIAATFLLLPAAGVAGIIGDFETDTDGWIDWTGAATTMAGGQTEGVTLGSGSLVVEQNGWGQSLALQLDVAQRADFMANSIFSIDVSVAATPGITGGWSEVFAVSMNAPGAGWQDVTSGAFSFYWWDGRPSETQTLEIDYSAYRDQITSPDYIEIIFALNTGGGAPSQMYFDNAQLVPEPATIGLLGIFGGGLLLVRRKFKL